MCHKYYVEEQRKTEAIPIKLFETFNSYQKFANNKLLLHYQ